MYKYGKEGGVLLKITRAIGEGEERREIGDGTRECQMTSRGLFSLSPSILDVARRDPLVGCHNGPHDLVQMQSHPCR